MAGADFDVSQKTQKTQKDWGKLKLGKTLAEIAENAERFGQAKAPVAADLQSDAKYYKDFQSVKQSLSQKAQKTQSLL